MRIDIHLRLQAAIRAMQEVVIPALGSADPMAREQAGLIVRHLEMASTQSDWELHVELAELADCAGLLQALEGDGDLVQRCAPWLGLKLGSRAQLRTLIHEVRTAIEARLEQVLAGPDDDRRQAAIKAVLAQSGRESVRERVWVGSAGYDENVGALPSIAVLLTPDER